MKITIVLSERQAAILVAALDLYSRVHIGQLEEVQNVLREAYWTEAGGEKLDHLAHLLEAAKSVLWGFSRGGSFGIHHPKVPDRARQAFDIKQALRNTIARAKNPAGGIGVSYDPPHATSLEEPMPAVVVEL